MKYIIKTIGYILFPIYSILFIILVVFAAFIDVVVSGCELDRNNYTCIDFIYNTFDKIATWYNNKIR